jgi:hypothetical protein
MRQAKATSKISDSRRRGPYQLWRAYNAARESFSSREAMKNLILFLAVVCAGAYVVFLSAAKEAADGPNWASDMCKVGRSFCQDPQLLVYGAAELAALWLIAVFASAIRN